MSRRALRSSDAGRMRLAPRAARTLYNLADAWLPPGAAGEPGGGDVDLAPAAEALLARERRGAARRLLAALAWLEWEPRVLLRGRRGFSWLSREARRRQLEAWERSVFLPRREAARRLRAWVEASFEAQRGEAERAAAPAVAVRPQSLGEE